MLQLIFGVNIKINSILLILRPVFFKDSFVFIQNLISIAPPQCYQSRTLRNHSCSKFLSLRKLQSWSNKLGLFNLIFCAQFWKFCAKKYYFKHINKFGIHSRSHKISEHWEEVYWEHSLYNSGCHFIFKKFRSISTFVTHLLTYFTIKVDFDNSNYAWLC